MNKALDLLIRIMQRMKLSPKDSSDSCLYLALFKRKEEKRKTMYIEKECIWKPPKSALNISEKESILGIHG